MMKRRDFTKFAAAGFVVAGGAYALTSTSTSTTSSSSTASAGTSSSGSTNGSTATNATIASAVPGVAYPFGARLAAYAVGTRPSASTATMDAVLKSQYDAWKARNLIDASSVVAGGRAVRFSDATYMTVSEGMGYGLLITVLFAGYDANARALFDGLLAVARTRYAYGNAAYDPSGKYLMDWRLYADGSSAGGGWNAMDGDLDMAMALLMADKQWGSAGSWNYLQEAKNTINALKVFNMAADGTTKGLRLPSVSRTSDYMIGHFRAFAAATGDTFWNTAIDRAYTLSNAMQTQYSAGAGLMPDFIVGTDTASPYPSPGYMGDGNDNENKYWWNACRNPWRFASDYLLSGDTRWKTICARLVDFFVASSGGNPVNIGTGYNLDGSMVTGGQSPAYHGPICAGACIDSKYQGFLDTMWTWNAANLTTGYYDCELQLLSLVVASGNWWSPLSKFSAGSGSSSSSSGSSSSSSGSTATSAAVAGNVLVNGDFSSGMSGWQNWGNASASGGALLVGTGAGGAGQDVTGKLTAGQKYQLTATASQSTSAEGVWVGVKLLDAYGNVLLNQTQLVTATSATGVNVSFTMPAGVASATVYVWKNASSASASIKGMVLAVAGSASTSTSSASGTTASASILANGDFSNGMTGWANWGNAAVSNGAMYVGTSAGGAGQDIASKLVPGKKYQLTATANITAAAEGVFVGVKLMDASGAALVNQSQLVSSTSPTAVSLTFTAPANIASGNVFVWKNANGAMGVIDNVSLVAIG